MKSITSDHPRAPWQVLVMLTFFAAALGCHNSVILGWDVADNTLDRDGGADGGADAGADAGDEDEDPGPKAQICWVDQPAAPQDEMGTPIIEAGRDSTYYLLWNDSVSHRRTSGEILWSTAVSPPVDGGTAILWMRGYNDGVIFSQRVVAGENNPDFWRIHRIDSDGTQLWTIQLGPCSDESPMTGLPIRVPVAFSPTGDIVLAAAYIGENPFEAPALSPAARKPATRGPIETALAAYDPDGQLLWTFDIETPLLPEGLVVKNDGTIVLVGPPTDPLWHGFYIMTAVSADGAQIWSHEVIEQSPLNEGDDLYVALYQGDGDTVFMTGNVAVQTDLKDSTGESLVFTSAFEQHENGYAIWHTYFVSQYNTKSDLLLNWATAGYSVDRDNTVGVYPGSPRKDNRGGIVLAGRLIGRIPFGQGEPNETVLGGHLRKGRFAARYNSDGTLDWARRIEFRSSLDAKFSLREIAPMPDGSIAVSAYFRESITFDLADGTEKTVTPQITQGNWVLIGLCAEPAR
jgi:hypothetical protein